MPATPHLGQLLDLFFQDPSDLGRIDLVEAEAMPAPYRQLLAHHDHMTVTVEAFHHSLVDVEVLEAFWEPPLYRRKILLRRQRDQAVVQFGLVLLDTSVLPEEATQEIIGGKIPLGRVLIEHNVLRQVHLSSLFRIQCGPELATLFAVPTGTETYGRTARIHMSGHPSLKLVEIVAPLNSSIDVRP